MRRLTFILLMLSTQVFAAMWHQKRCPVDGNDLTSAEIADKIQRGFPIELVASKMKVKPEDLAALGPLGKLTVWADKVEAPWPWENLAKAGVRIWLVSTSDQMQQEWIEPYGELGTLFVDWVPRPQWSAGKGVDSPLLPPNGIRHRYRTEKHPYLKQFPLFVIGLASSRTVLIDDDAIWGAAKLNYWEMKPFADAGALVQVYSSVGHLDRWEREELASTGQLRFVINHRMGSIEEFVGWKAKGFHFTLYTTEYYLSELLIDQLERLSIDVRPSCLSHYF